MVSKTRTKTRIRQREVIAYLVQSRTIHDHDGYGHRFPGGKIHWGPGVTWNRHINNILNIREAIKEVVQRLNVRHIGAMIYIRKVVNHLPTKTAVPIFEAKWGHDDLPFISWKSNPVADYWRRQVGVGKPAKPRKPETTIMRPYGRH